jgi:hypothetical protein
MDQDWETPQAPPTLLSPSAGRSARSPDDTSQIASRAPLRNFRCGEFLASRWFRSSPIFAIPVQSGAMITFARACPSST